MIGYWVGFAGPFDTYAEAAKFAEVAGTSASEIEYVSTHGGVGRLVNA